MTTREALIQKLQTRLEALECAARRDAQIVEYWRSQEPQNEEDVRIIRQRIAESEEHATYSGGALRLLTAILKDEHHDA